MEKNFMADINIKMKKNDGNVVKIIPFHDKDKSIARKIEKILNQELQHFDNDDFDDFDTVGFRIRV